MDWKKSFIRAAGFGAGFAILSVAMVGGLIWYNSRPKPTQPWDSTTIQASFEKVLPEHQLGMVRMRYMLTNKGAEDYHINSKDLVKMALKIGDDGELTPVNRIVTLETPIFVPAGHKTMVFLDLNTGQTSDSFRRPLSAEPSEKEERDYQEAVNDYLSHTRISGFATFDEIYRLEIDFPAGWKTARTTH